MAPRAYEPRGLYLEPRVRTGRESGPVKIDGRSSVAVSRSSLRTAIPTNIFLSLALILKIFFFLDRIAEFWTRKHNFHYFSRASEPSHRLLWYIMVITGIKFEFQPSTFRFDDQFIFEISICIASYLSYRYISPLWKFENSNCQLLGCV